MNTKMQKAYGIHIYFVPPAPDHTQFAIIIRLEI